MKAVLQLLVKLHKEPGGYYTACETAGIKKPEFVKQLYGDAECLNRCKASYLAAARDGEQIWWVRSSPGGVDRNGRSIVERVIAAAPIRVKSPETVVAHLRLETGVGREQGGSGVLMPPIGVDVLRSPRPAIRVRRKFAVANAEVAACELALVQLSLRLSQGSAVSLLVSDGQLPELGGFEVVSQERLEEEVRNALAAEDEVPSEEALEQEEGEPLVERRGRLAPAVTRMQRVTVPRFRAYLSTVEGVLKPSNLWVRRRQKRLDRSEAGTVRDGMSAVYEALRQSRISDGEAVSRAQFFDLLISYHLAELGEATESDVVAAAREVCERECATEWIRLVDACAWFCDQDERLLATAAGLVRLVSEWLFREAHGGKRLVVGEAEEDDNAQLSAEAALEEVD